MTLKAHLLYEYTPQETDRLRRQLHPSIRLTIGELDEQQDDLQILIAGRPAREIFLANKDLHTLIIPWTGVPPETSAVLDEFPHIAVHNLHHNAQPVAEMTIALLLAAARNIIPADRSLRQGDWTIRYQNPAPALTLAGRTALILGYGEIGRRVGHVCHALGMDVLALKRSVSDKDNDPLVQSFHTPEELHTLLPQVEALIITLPLTRETKDFIGKRELALLPSKSILVNIGRALIVNEEALYSALKNGDLGAAGLDVWYNYPADPERRTDTFPANHPFWDLDNVVMSPHRAGLTADIDTLRMDHLAILLNATAKNEQMPNKVDLNKGY